MYVYILRMRVYIHHTHHTMSTQRGEKLPSNIVGVLFPFASFNNTITLLAFNEFPIRWGPYDTYSSSIDQT